MHNLRTSRYSLDDIIKITFRANQLWKKVSNQIKACPQLDPQLDIECGFTLKRVRDMIKTYS